MSIRSRVIDAVERWYTPGTEDAVPTSKLLVGLWIRNTNLDFDILAKRELISELKTEFCYTSLGLTPGGINESTRVQDIVLYVETR